MPEQHDNSERLVAEIIRLIGDDPGRKGLLETPARVVRSWAELFDGYDQDPEAIVKTFDLDDCQLADCGKDYPGDMVYLRDIEFHSTCEHHMLPFIGVAHVGYIPDKIVIGASKMARLVDCFAHRLQIQERICHQVTSTIMSTIAPKGAACIIEAKHQCMVCRGVRKQHSVMGSSSMRGSFMDNLSTRMEFISLITRR